MRSVGAGLLLVGLATCVVAEEKAKPIELFNGKDLAGWVNVNGAPDTWTVRDGSIVCTGKPKGVLRSERMYENYVLELEWKHLQPKGNSGLMVHADALPQVGAPYPRSVEVQIMDGDHGSMFGIRGCKVTAVTRPRPNAKGGRAQPTEDRCKPAGEWNQYVLTSRDGTLELAVNGKAVTKVTNCSQVKGYVCLEAEGSETHFRNLRLTPLPSSNPVSVKVAQADEGLRSIFDGLSFKGWRHPAALDGAWVVKDGVFAYNGGKVNAKGDDRHVRTEKEYGDYVLVADWRLPRKPEMKALPTFTPDGLFVRDKEGKVVRKEILDAGDSGIYLRGLERYQVNIWSQPMGSGDINAVHKDAKLPVEIRQACVPKQHIDAALGQWNRFYVTLRGDVVTVVLNGTTVIDNAKLPGVPPRGRIVLQNHGDPVEFRNLYVKELDGAR